MLIMYDNALLCTIMSQKLITIKKIKAMCYAKCSNIILTS